MHNKSLQAKRLNAFELKCIAVVSMLLDHIGVLLVPYTSSLPFRLVGRLSFPIFCFFIVEGQRYTHNSKKYILRILVLAIISEPIFDRVFYGNFIYLDMQSALFTLLIGLLSIVGLDKVKQRFATEREKKLYIKVLYEAFIVSVASVAVILIKAEYGVLGLATIILFYSLKKHNGKYYFVGLLIINALSFEWLQVSACLAALPIALYNGKQGRKLKYAFYAFYPIHLLALFAISLIIGSRLSTASELHYVESSIISQGSITSVNVNRIVNIQVEQNQSDNDYTIPLFSVGTNDMAVFTLKNESGWAIKTGDLFKISLHSDSTDHPDILLGTIVNGMYNDLIPIQESTYEIAITAYLDGEYYFTIINVSEDILSIEGDIILSNSDG